MNQAVNQALAAVSAATAGAVAGAAVDGAPGAIWGAAAPLIERVLFNVASHGWRLVGDYAADTPEEFTEVVENLSRTPEGEELLLRTLEAARWTSLDDKLRAFGRALGAGGNDSDRIDQEIIFVEAVSAISAPHLRALRVLATPRSEAGVMHVGQYGDDIYDAEDLRTADRALDSSVLPQLMGVLTGTGLVELHSFAHWEDAGGPTATWRITKMGRRLVKRARERADR